MMTGPKLQSNYIYLLYIVFMSLWLQINSDSKVFLKQNFFFYLQNIDWSDCDHLGVNFLPLYIVVIYFNILFRLKSELFWSHMYVYCVTVFIFKLWFTVKYLCIQTCYRVESDWVNNNLEIGIQVIIFSSLVCEEYPSFTSQGCFSDWYVVSFKISVKLSKFPVINSIGR